MQGEPIRMQPLLRHEDTGVLNVLIPPQRRWRVLLGFAAIAFLQGSSFACFSMMPAAAIDLFPAFTLDNLPWTLNCNNVAQMLFIPFCIYLLRKSQRGSTGLRQTALIASVCQLLQALLWVFCLSIAHENDLSLVVLLIGASMGGIVTGCVQGACSRLSSVWFPPSERASATALTYAALFLGQSLAYAICLMLCSARDLKVLLYVQLGLGYAGIYSRDLVKRGGRA